MLMWPFFLVLIGLGFCLAMYFFFFFDILTPERVKVLIKRQLSGVRLRCQIGVIWFWLTPKRSNIPGIRYFLTPLIINELSGFGVRWCQIMNSQSDTKEVTEGQRFMDNSVRSVRLFQKKSIVKK